MTLSQTRSKVEPGRWTVERRPALGPARVEADDAVTELDCSVARLDADEHRNGGSRGSGIRGREVHAERLGRWR